MPTLCTCTSCAIENTRRDVLCALYECRALFNRYEDGAGFYYCGEHAGFCSSCETEELVSDLSASGECAECSRPVCSVCGYRFNPNEDDETCDDCLAERSSRMVHDYSYRPRPNFLKLPDDPDNGLYFGFELEVGTDEPGELAETLYYSHGAEESVLYCKHDSSVDGVEIVSHPMTHGYFSERFPFAMFTDRNLDLEEEQPIGHGLHIHVSRAGFKSNAHVMRWLMLFYRNSAEIERLARRCSDHWAGFTDRQRCGRKARGSRMGDRYVAVNAQNRDTFEVRVFRSTWREQELRAAMDFMHASVTYTRSVTANDTIQRDALGWRKFRRWVAEREQYAALDAELVRLSNTEPEHDNDEEDY